MTNTTTTYCPGTYVPMYCDKCQFLNFCWVIVPVEP